MVQFEAVRIFNQASLPDLLARYTARSIKISLCGSEPN